MAYSYLKTLELNFNHNSLWYTNDRKEYINYLHIDVYIRNILLKKLSSLPFIIGEIGIDISKHKNEIIVTISTIVINRVKKLDHEYINNYIINLCKSVKEKFDIKELNSKTFITNDNIYSAMVIAQTLEHEMRKNISFRILSRLAQEIISSGALGCILEISGRINGYSITRKDSIKLGTINRNTLKNNITFFKHVSINKSGTVGIKVWLNKNIVKNKT